jgi:hypothetical protein
MEIVWIVPTARKSATFVISLTRANIRNDHNPGEHLGKDLRDPGHLEVLGCEWGLAPGGGPAGSHLDIRNNFISC